MQSAFSTIRSCNSILLFDSTIRFYHSIPQFASTLRFHHSIPTFDSTIRFHYSISLSNSTIRLFDRRRSSRGLLIKRHRNRDRVRPSVPVCGALIDDFCHSIASRPISVLDGSGSKPSVSERSEFEHQSKAPEPELQHAIGTISRFTKNSRVIRRMFRILICKSVANSQRQVVRGLIVSAKNQLKNFKASYK